MVMLVFVESTVYPEAKAMPIEASVPVVAGLKITRIGSVELAANDIAMRECRIDALAKFAAYTSFEKN
jgi:hypothetical protein